MLDLWRLAAGLVPAEAEASVERFDCLDIDRRLEIAMRAWYLDLLDNAAVRYLAPENISARLVWQRDSATGTLAAEIPADVRRVLAVRMDVFSLPVDFVRSGRDLVVPADGYVFTRSICSPLCYGDVPPEPAGASAFSAFKVPGVVLAITDPGEETYILDDSALSLIGHADFWPDNGITS